MSRTTLLTFVLLMAVGIGWNGRILVILLFVTRQIHWVKSTSNCLMLWPVKLIILTTSSRQQTSYNIAMPNYYSIQFKLAFNLIYLPWRALVYSDCNERQLNCSNHSSNRFAVVVVAAAAENSQLKPFSSFCFPSLTQHHTVTHTHERTQLTLD